MDGMSQLEGRKIRAVWLSDDHERLVFETDQGDLAYGTYGDCCSSTWFNDILGVDALIGGTVASVENVELEDPESEKDWETLQDYGIKITTDLGYCDIIYRNSSNGYYGGWCEPDEDDSIPETMIAIHTDWAA